MAQIASGGLILGSPVTPLLGGGGGVEGEGSGVEGGGVLVLQWDSFNSQPLCEETEQIAH